MHAHETIKAYQTCSRKRRQWNEWLVFKVVASVLRQFPGCSPVPGISFFIQKSASLKRDIWDQAERRVLWNWNFKMHFFFVILLSEKDDSKHIKWIYAQIPFLVIICARMLFPFILLFLLVKIYTCSVPKMPGLCMYLL